MMLGGTRWAVRLCLVPAEGYHSSPPLGPAPLLGWASPACLCAAPSLHSSSCLGYF